MLIDGKEAASLLKKGEVIAYPTEAVYGFGCDPSNDDAILKILKLKQRDPSKGMLIVGAILGHILPFVGELDPDILNKVMKTWPGPVTWILPTSMQLSGLLTGGRPTIAARVSAHQTVNEICNQYCKAIVSTSVNIQGEEPFKTAQEVMDAFPNIPVVAGEIGQEDKPTQIIDSITDKIIR